MDFLNHIKDDTLQIAYGSVAIIGGIARYLNMYSSGQTPFSLKMFLASTFVSGFSGYMFSLIGLSLSLPTTFIFMMAGSGGFFGDQTMKYVTEYVTTKTS